MGEKHKWISFHFLVWLGDAFLTMRFSPPPPPPRAHPTTDDSDLDFGTGANTGDSMSNLAGMDFCLTPGADDDWCHNPTGMAINHRLLPQLRVAVTGPPGTEGLCTYNAVESPDAIPHLAVMDGFMMGGVEGVSYSQNGNYGGHVNNNNNNNKHGLFAAHDHVHSQQCQHGGDQRHGGEVLGLVGDSFYNHHDGGLNVVDNGHYHVGHHHQESGAGWYAQRTLPSSSHSSQGSIFDVPADTSVAMTTDEAGDEVETASAGSSPRGSFPDLAAYYSDEEAYDQVVAMGQANDGKQGSAVHAGPEEEAEEEEDLSRADPEDLKLELGALLSELEARDAPSHDLNDPVVARVLVLADFLIADSYIEEMAPGIVKYTHFPIKRFSPRRGVYFCVPCGRCWYRPQTRSPSSHAHMHAKTREHRAKLDLA